MGRSRSFLLRFSHTCPRRYIHGRSQQEMETLGSMTANRTTAHTLITVRDIYAISPFTNGGFRNKTQKKERASV